MTRFGKLLVFLQLILSFLMFTWAAGLYSQRLGWAPARRIFGDDPVPGLVSGVVKVAGEDKVVPGKIDQEIERLVTIRDQDEERWQAMAKAFHHLEDQRNQYLAWYADQAHIAEKGYRKDDPGKKPVVPTVRQLIRGPDGLLIMDDDKRDPVLAGKNIVKCVDDYKAIYDEVSQKLEREQQELDKLAEQLKDITETIAGIPGKTPGLRGQLLSELTYLKLHEDEMAYLTPQLNARRVESQVLVRRLQYLKERRKELYAALGIDKGDE